MRASTFVAACTFAAIAGASLVPTLSLSPPRLAVNIHYAVELPGTTRMLSNAGFSFVRMDLGWGSIEQVPRVYNFSAFDALFTTLTEYNVLPMLIFDYANDLYCSGQSPDTPECIAAFVAYARAALARYANRGVLWEAYNEPNLNGGPNCSTSGTAGFTTRLEAVRGKPLGGWSPCANATAYMDLFSAVGAMMAAEFPGEVLVGPAAGQGHGTDQLDLPFMTALLRGGALQYLRGITIHPYRPTSPEDAISEYVQLRQLLDSFSPNGSYVPILCGEMGYSTANVPHTGAALVNETTQAKYLPRMWLVNLGCGVNLTNYYDAVDDGDNDTYIEDRFGLVRHAYLNASLPHLPKPAYTAAQAMTAHVGPPRQGVPGCDFLALLEISFEPPPPPQPQPPVCYVAYFSCPDAAYAAWCLVSDGQVYNVTFPPAVPAMPPAVASPVTCSRGGSAPCWSSFESMLRLRLPSPGVHEFSAAAESWLHPGPSTHGTAAPCLSAWDYMGASAAGVCVTGDPAAYTAEASNGPTYFRSAQLDR